MENPRYCAEAHRWLASGIVVMLIAGCGGGGGSDPPFANDGNGGGSGSGWVEGQFLPADGFAAHCESPRTGSGPGGEPYPDVQGETLDENNWLRSWSNDLYLWYDEIVDRDPGLYNDTLNYFDLLKTNAITASGNPRDRFHFTYPTDAWIVLSQSGVSAGYGATWAVRSALPPREILVTYTEPGSPAEAAGLRRGHRILSINGIDAVSDNTQAGVDVLLAALYPSEPGMTFQFELELHDGTASYAATLVSDLITSTPVQNVGTVTSPMGATAGYLLFNDHIATAEQQLVDAIEQLSAANIEDLIIDMRYNGGGFLFIASELAYMIAGNVPTAGRVFEEFQFNDKHPTTNPVTGQALEPLPFFNEYVPAPGADPQPLPSLDLPRVFVLTGSGTCSSSESLMNSLRAVGVEVIQIGNATCGKPYGFYPADNCGTTYFTIQFKGVNDAGFGDYADGFFPSGNGSGNGADQLPGCEVEDDFAHKLGDPLEARLAMALSFRDTSVCAVSPALSDSRDNSTLEHDQQLRGEAIVYKSPWLTNRILSD